MATRMSSFYVGVVLATVVSLTGCGGSQAGSSITPQGNGLPAARHDRAGSRKIRAGQTTSFTVSGRELLLNGKPFFIKGMDYGNAQINGWPDPNPLDDANEPIWSPDLAAMRAAGVNAVKVYNISLNDFRPYYDVLGQNFFLKNYETGKIGKFLDAAWNGGNHPIYVVLSIAFAGPSVLIPSYTKVVSKLFESAAKEYGAYPAFMGFSIGNEINDADVRVQPAWWAGLNQMNDAIKAGYKAAGADKITTTTMVDDNMETLKAGERNHFGVDVWGINSYRGWNFTDIWKQFSQDTTKPAIISEYGYSTAYYTPSTAKYDTTLHNCPENTYPPGTEKKPFYGLPPPRPWELVKELPATGNPNIQDYVNLVKANATEIYDHSIGQGGADAVGSGGFYFEWNDEWWKSGWPNEPHIGGEGNIISANPVFPGCYRDEGWFGLNAVAKTGPGTKPFPDRTPDKRIPKPALAALEAVFRSE
jgi:hypothetical protein